MYVCVCVCLKKALHCHPVYTQAISMFEQHKIALLVCTCEHIAPLNTAMLLPSEVEVLGTSVFVRSRERERERDSVSVYVCVCESVGASKSRGGENTHSRSVHPSRVRWVSLNHRNTESYESNQHFC